MLLLALRQSTGSNAVTWLREGRIGGGMDSCESEVRMVKDQKGSFDGSIFTTMASEGGDAFRMVRS